jgi:hypothetical protein
MNNIICHMEHSPSEEANSHLAGEEIPCFLWNLNVHYCVHNSLPLVNVGLFNHHYEMSMLYTLRLILIRDICAKANFPFLFLHTGL